MLSMVTTNKSSQHSINQCKATTENSRPGSRVLKYQKIRALADTTYKMACYILLHIFVAKNWNLQVLLLFSTRFSPQHFPNFLSSPEILFSRQLVALGRAAKNLCHLPKRFSSGKKLTEN